MAVGILERKVGIPQIVNHTAESVRQSIQNFGVNIPNFLRTIRQLAKLRLISKPEIGISDPDRTTHNLQQTLDVLGTQKHAAIEIAKLEGPNKGIIAIGRYEERLGILTERVANDSQVREALLRLEREHRLREQRPDLNEYI